MEKKFTVLFLIIISSGIVLILGAIFLKYMSAAMVVNKKAFATIQETEKNLAVQETELEQEKKIISFKTDMEILKRKKKFFDEIYRQEIAILKELKKVFRNENVLLEYLKINESSFRN